MTARVLCASLMFGQQAWQISLTEMISVLLDISSRTISLGFSTNSTGGHLARSMMLTELTALTAHLPANADLEAYSNAILIDNVLGKPTFASRDKSLRHLVQLYGLSPRLTLFRVLRNFAADYPASLPLIAVTCAFCRDEQLRASFKLIRELRAGQALTRQRMEGHLEESFPGRFSTAMKKSLAQNVDTSWTKAGHLSGRSVKVRTLPQARMLCSTYAMFAGYLLGLRGDLLISSVFGELVAPASPILVTHLSEASSRGYLRFRHAGGVTEIDFSPLLSSEEHRLVHGSN